MTLFYAVSVFSIIITKEKNCFKIFQGIGTTMAYIALLLQFFALNHISMANISTAFDNATKN